jgi:hypothetical protein
LQVEKNKISDIRCKAAAERERQRQRDGDTTEKIDHLLVIVADDAAAIYAGLFPIYLLTREISDEDDGSRCRWVWSSFDWSTYNNVTRFFSALLS